MSYHWKLNSRGLCIHEMWRFRGTEVAGKGHLTITSLLILHCSPYQLFLHILQVHVSRIFRSELFGSNELSIESF